MRMFRRITHRARWPLFLFILANVLAASAAAQEPAGGASTTGDCSPVVVGASGEVTINVECRLPLSPKELDELKEAVATLSESSERLTALPADLLDRHERLSRRLGVTDQALTNFFRILNEENVPAEDLDARLREVAGRHLQLLERVVELDALAEKVATLRDRARAAIERGNYDAADAALKEAHAAREGALAKEAAQLYLEAADLLPRSRPREKVEYLIRASEILLSHDDSYDQAADPLFRAAAIQETRLGEYHWRTAELLEHLAFKFDLSKRPKEAERCYKRALAIYERVESDAEDRSLYRRDSQLAVAKVLHSLAGLHVYGLRERYDAAEQYCKRALTIYEARGEKEEENFLEALGLLARIFAEQGRVEEAEAHFKRHLAMLEERYGRDHYKLRFPLVFFGRFYEQQQRYAEAERLYKRVMVIMEDDPWSLQLMARLYINQRRYKDAAALLKRSLVLYEAALGKDHRVTRHVRKKLKAVKACTKNPESCAQGIEDGNRLAYPGMP